LTREWCRAVPKQPTFAECITCGSTFERCGKGSGRVRTCSKACRVEHRRTRERDYGAAYRQRPEVLEKSESRKRLPTADEVRAVLDYDPDSGTLTWKVRQGDDRATKAWNAKHLNKQAGSLGKHGYVSIAIFGQPYRAHRLIWVIQTGAWPASDQHIDHIDGNPSNNVFSNLRLATVSLNMANAKRPSTNRSGYKGAYFKKNMGRYAAGIKVNQRVYHLGHFDTPEEAHAAYISAAERFFGEFARAA
jgi:hypothetical protein